MTDKNEPTTLELLLEMSAKLGNLEQKMNAIPQERHTEEHDYLKLEIEAKKARRDFYRGVTEKLATTTIIGAFGLLLTAIGYGYVQFLISLKP
jgi:hypothetical protein